MSKVFLNIQIFQNLSTIFLHIIPPNNGIIFFWLFSNMEKIQKKIEINDFFSFFKLVG